MSEVCRYCGKAAYTHLGTCPRVKSITIHADDSETVELRTPDGHLMLNTEVLAMLVSINSALKRIEDLLGGRAA